jgi:hypothetical protein
MTLFQFCVALRRGKGERIHSATARPAAFYVQRGGLQASSDRARKVETRRLRADPRSTGFHFAGAKHRRGGVMPHCVTDEAA